MQVPSSRQEDICMCVASGHRACEAHLGALVNSAGVGLAVPAGRTAFAVQARSTRVAPLPPCSRVAALNEATSECFARSSLTASLNAPVPAP